MLATAVRAEELLEEIIVTNFAHLDQKKQQAQLDQLSRLARGSDPVLPVTSEPVRSVAREPSEPIAHIPARDVKMWFDTLPRIGGIVGG